MKTCSIAVPMEGIIIRFEAIKIIKKTTDLKSDLAAVRELKFA